MACFAYGCCTGLPGEGEEEGKSVKNLPRHVERLARKAHNGDAMAKRMVHKQLASILVGSALLLSPMVSCADYVMQLTTGRELHVLTFTKEKDKYIVELPSGTLTLSVAAVQSITEKQRYPEVEIITPEARPAPPVIKDQAPTAPQALQALHDLERQRDALQSKLEELVEQYREALGTPDREKQGELLQQITGTTRDYHALNDQVLRKNTGAHK
jgi:hypothetical protein